MNTLGTKIDKLDSRQNLKDTKSKIVEEVTYWCLKFNGDVFFISNKTGEGIKEVLKAITGSKCSHDSNDT